jgi:tetratricopeptide (TPR) repeat protein
VACFVPLSAQPTPPPKQGELKKDRAPAKTSDKEEIPPEEDTSLAKDDFSFNPLQAQKEIEIGKEYFKKHSFGAAAGRFRNATKFNEGNAEAWRLLGESEEKLKDVKAAREAYAKYLEVASNAKDAAEIKKRLQKLKEAFGGVSQPSVATNKSTLL